MMLLKIVVWMDPNHTTYTLTLPASYVDSDQPKGRLRRLADYLVVIALCSTLVGRRNKG